MELFDKKFVYLEWNDCLKCKKVLVCDGLQLMRRQVNDGTAKLRCVEDNSRNSELCPFIDECGTSWALVYYDPNYECKVAYAQGKIIQYKSHYSFEWKDCDDPKWSDKYEYRVKPEEPEKKWRPFKDIQELRNAWSDKAGLSVDYEEPMIWVRDKERPDITRLIIAFNADHKSVSLAGYWCALESLFNDYEFLDGTPCGVEE